MAFNKTLMASLLVSLFVIQLVHAIEPHTTSNHMISKSGNAESEVDCGAACEVRCSDTKRPNLCKRACGSCCSKCKCVPPGTYGNYEACPCYANLTTHDSRHKCP